jgi:hypothetical protein
LKVELFIVPLAAIEEELKVFVQEVEEIDKNSHLFSFPRIALTTGFYIGSAFRALLQAILGHLDSGMVEAWLQSSRCTHRIVDSYDRESLFEAVPSVAIVRAVAIPQDFATAQTTGRWISVRSLLEQNSFLSPDNLLFLKECIKLVPLWTKNTSFPFELMSHIFSIQELRNLISLLSNQEIDPGNFHRRLKKLDILKPLTAGGQRIHRWEYAWERGGSLIKDGLLP